MLTNKFSDTLCMPLKKRVQGHPERESQRLVQSGVLQDKWMFNCSAKGGRQRRQINSSLGPHEMAQLWKLQVAEFMQNQVSKGVTSCRTW